MHNKESFAIREGKWKLVRNTNAAPELYDLGTDIGEKNNVAAATPKVVTRLDGVLHDWRKELVEPVFPGSSVKNEDWGPGGANQKAKPDAAKKEDVAK